MRRAIIPAPSFIRAAKRLVKRDPQVAESLRTALRTLAEDAFHPSLKTHKLKGHLEGSWGCSAGYDVRIVFTFVQHQGGEAVLLETVGSHDQVY